MSGTMLLLPDLVSAPALITASASGADAPNVVLMLDLVDGKGWSALDFSVSSFCVWPEGDYSTQRRLLTLTGGSSNIDPAAGDVTRLIAIYKLFDPERFTLETYVTDETGTISQGDPFEMEWKSSELSVGADGDVNIVRAVYLRYRRPTYDFDVEVWVDGEPAYVKTVSPSWPEPSEVRFPLPAVANVGSLIQLIVRDRTDVDLKIEKASIKFRPKRWRMP